MDHYPRPMCNGVIKNSSGKGGGPRFGTTTMRHQTVYAFKAWGMGGTDLYFSSRWDKSWQIFDHYWVKNDLTKWWTSKTWEYVFVGEVPYDIEAGEFVWEHAAKTMNFRQLKGRRWRQLQAAKRPSRSRSSPSPSP